ncbi:MAG: ABC transporter ATP-binding protein, partial [Bacteroidota bacterium]
MIKYWRRLLPLFRPHLPELFVLFACLCVTTSSSLVMIPLAKFVSTSFSHLTLAKLNLVVALAVGAYFLKGLVTYAQNLLVAPVTLRVVAALRSQLFAKILSLSLSFHRHQRTGEVASRLVSDVSLVRDALAFVSDLLPSFMIFAGSVITLFFINWRLALLSLFGIPLVGLAISQFGGRIRQASHAIQSKVADILAYIQEAVSSILVVKGFGQEQAEQERFDQFNDRHFLATFRCSQIQALQNPLIGTIQILAFAGVLWYAGWEILHGRLTTPDLFAFGAALGVAIDPTLVISNAYGKFSTSTAALVRVYEFLDTAPTVVESPDAVSPAECRGELHLEGVSFAYEDRPVLAGVDLSLKPGE